MSRVLKASLERARAQQRNTISDSGGTSVYEHTTRGSSACEHTTTAQRVV